MNTIQVFHGSDHVVKKPLYGGGRPDNDHGNGFYTTEYEDRARSWAALNGVLIRNRLNPLLIELCSVIKLTQNLTIL